MLIPSIDLMNGRAVQLRQGKTHVLTAERDPLDLAAEYNRYGEVAVIDLDAALGQGDNLPLIRQLCRVADVRVGGGIRSLERADALLRAGAQKLIIGTAATPEFLAKLPADKVMVAIDHKGGEVVDDGWRTGTGESVFDRAARLAPYCSGFLCTFVENEGGLTGMNLEELKQYQAQLPHPVTVAGGVADTAEAIAIVRAGFDVQVGMALYTGRLDPVAVTVGVTDFDKCDGLIPTVVQDAASGQVLMLAYSSPESLAQALSSGQGTYFSRSRQALWVKGGTSGHTQALTRVRLDCDADALLFSVQQTGPACHTGADSCFGPAHFGMAQLFDTLRSRVQHPPEGSYTAKLLNNRMMLYKKLIEEAFEVTQAPDRDNRVWEAADVVYFLSVLAVAEGIDWPEVLAELGGRHR
jgi:phosphoribosyl-ATP pyrophosphohydrolase/phosphoribosyl-AMP cyclohydrolase